MSTKYKFTELRLHVGLLHGEMQMENENLILFISAAHRLAKLFIVGLSLIMTSYSMNAVYTVILGNTLLSRSSSVTSHQILQISRFC
jgi:hypothetical protein